MSNKSLITIRLIDAVDNPIKGRKYKVINNKTGQIIAAGPTNNKGCIVEISRDKGTTLDVYFESAFGHGLMKVPQNIVMSKDRMIVTLRTKEIKVKLSTKENQGTSGTYKRKTYTIKKGDTLSVIAQKEGTTVRALVYLNNLKNPDKLAIGQVLKLPVNVPATGNNNHQNKPKPKQQKAASQSKTKDKKSSDVSVFEQAKQKLNEYYEEGKKKIDEASKVIENILTIDDRSKETTSPKVDANNLCKTKPQCISSGKSELIREVNIRLAGFGGALPSDEFTDLTASCIKQFQRDYMGAPETGKICGSVLIALDQFRDEFGIASFVNGMKCPCGKCSGFGKGRADNFNFPLKDGGSKRVYATEYPGMHRSLIWGFKAMQFYFSKMPNSKGYKISNINSGYRCVDNNLKNKRPTTNHMGNALDLQILNKSGQKITGDELENIVRPDWFCKYLKATMGWQKNRFGLEQQKHGAKSWVHIDVREFEKEYKANKLYSKTKDGLNGDYLVKLFKTDKQASATLSCSGSISSKESTLSDTTLEELIIQLGDAIASGEGSYEAWNAGAPEGKKVKFGSLNDVPGTITGKSINQLLDASKNYTWEDRRRRFATGKYQTIPSTLLSAKNRLKLSGNELYDKDMQEKVFREHLLRVRPAIYQLITTGNSTVTKAMIDASKEWASIALPQGEKNKYGVVSDGKIGYHQSGTNKANSHSTAKVKSIFEKIKVYYSANKG